MGNHENPAAPPPSARSEWPAALEAALAERKEARLFRELRRIDATNGPEITAADTDGGASRTLVNFCSNNYLGLADHPEVIAAAQEATGRFGAGSGASRLVSGSLAPHQQLEAALAAFKGTEAALLFPTGYMANLAVLTTFAGEGDLIVSDKLNHASLLDAARFSGAQHRTFPHRHYERARELLARPTPAEGGRRFIVTDSVFSMDGDVANLPALCAVAEETGALVILDEAHATGVLGPRGAGLAEAQGVESRVALTVGTLSKALGSLGGFVAGPRAAIDTLINSARSFIYTTALPAACSAAALAALQIIQRESHAGPDGGRRGRVMRLAKHVRQSLESAGYTCGDSETPIVPVILGDAARTLEASTHLRQQGLFVSAIRPPTVPRNSARLRISLMASHTDAHVEQLVHALRTLPADLRR